MKKNIIFPEYLAKPAQRALQNAGIASLKELTKFSELEILKLHGMGRSGLGLIIKGLKEKGWSFAKK